MNSLVELGKNFRGDVKIKESVVPFFKIFTVLDPNHVNWKIVHEPSYDELKYNIVDFITKIIHVTKVVPDIEKVFRDKRKEKIDEIKAEF